ncbi:MAG: hypothetical protein HY834_16290 [Devosia nanyangense]|uniref:Uncharacterized protein n=1 Tax=Devosia nanyangense TaxID=1228055 RepID=A0A933P076_9HYPH|nr:hypothetical protein [Devosia nanyangense]
MAVIAYFLFAVSGGAMPDMTALAAFDSQAACQAAAASVTEALSGGEDGNVIVCVSADSLKKLAEDNPA